jgi:hypothetical protein
MRLEQWEPPMTKHENTPLPVLRCALMLVTLAYTPAFAAGEDPLPEQSLAPGMRVRILAPDISPHKVIGTIDQVSDESMTLEVRGRSGPVSVPREKILRLDVSDGSRSRGVDAAIGAGIGAGVGAAGGALAGGSGHGHLVSSGEVAAVCAVLGGALGALIGAAIPPGEHWKEIPAARYRVGFSPRLDHGLDLAVAWNF